MGPHSPAFPDRVLRPLVFDSHCLEGWRAGATLPGNTGSDMRAPFTLANFQTLPLLVPAETPPTSTMSH